MTSTAPVEGLTPAASEEPPDSAEHLAREARDTVETLTQRFNGIVQTDMSANPPGYHDRAMQWWKTCVKEQKLPAAIVAAVNRRIETICMEIASLS